MIRDDAKKDKMDLIREKRVMERAVIDLLLEKNDLKHKIGELQDTIYHLNLKVDLSGNGVNCDG